MYDFVLREWLWAYSTMFAVMAARLRVKLFIVSQIPSTQQDLLSFNKNVQ